MNTRYRIYFVFSLGVSGLLVVGLFLLLSSTPQNARAAPVNLFVTTAGSGTDCTQVNPCDLGTAASQSADGDTIYVAQGTYTATGEALLEVTESATFFGGWDGSMTSPVVRDPEIYLTTLDGQNTRRVVYISGDIAPTLDGFIITRGNASTAADDPGCGGGIYSSQADPIITNNNINNNIATNAEVWGSGGGIYIENSYGNPESAVIWDNLIANNTASNAFDGNGGGLMVVFSSGVIVRDNILQNNTAGSISDGNGGGMNLNNSDVVVSGNLIQGNQATPAGNGFGGGIYSEFGDLTLSGNSILGNAAEYGTLTFQYNTNLTVTNNIIAQNSGSGVLVRGRDTAPVSVILAHNTIAENGQEGIYAGWWGSGSSTLTLTNNIITGHITGIYVYPATNPNVVTATHTLFYNNDDNTGGDTITSTNEITGSDPRFLIPADGNFHLWPNSPAIDAGTPVPWLTTDIDGDSRPLPAGGDYDIGADEALWLPVYLPVVVNGSQ